MGIPRLGTIWRLPQQWLLLLWLAELLTREPEVGSSGSV